MNEHVIGTGVAVAAPDVLAPAEVARTTTRC